MNLVLRSLLCCLTLTASGHIIAITPQPTDEIQGMVGKQPKVLCWLMHQFNNPQTRSGIFLNRLLLYGPPGNGKSTIGKKFADMTDSIFIARSACSMVERYVGQGATNVAELFATAHTMAKDTGKKVVVFIDEIDALAASNTNEFRAEHKAALQQLWIELDLCKHDKNICVIFATNEFKKLSKTFLDRFGCNTIEIANPTTELRKQILTYYFAQAELPIDESLLATLAAKSNNLSNRALEDMVYGIKMTLDLAQQTTLTPAIALEALKTIQDKFKNNTSDEDGDDKKLQRTSTWVSIVSGSLSSILNSYYLATIAAGLVGLTVGSQTSFAKSA